MKGVFWENIPLFYKNYKTVRKPKDVSPSPFCPTFNTDMIPRVMTDVLRSAIEMQDS